MLGVYRPNVYKLAIERRCEQIAKDSLPPPQDIDTDAYRQWLGGLLDELRFWYLSVALDGWNWAAAYKSRLNSDFPFQFPGCISHFSDHEILCLEVGAGAMAALGTVCSGKTITIVPTDALANAFEIILKDFGVKARFPVIECDAESLQTHFQEESFHFAYANNCLDHCYNPLSAIQQMYALIKPSGSIVLGHHLNVAEAENYEGLHQWNLCIKDNRFVLWNKTAEHFIDYELPPDAIIAFTVSTEQNWLTVTITKPQHE